MLWVCPSPKYPRARACRHALMLWAGRRAVLVVQVHACWVTCSSVHQLGPILLESSLSKSCGSTPRISHPPSP
eukprot:12880049-Prorocentrum_lima.AAC.1